MSPSQKFSVVNGAAGQAVSVRSGNAAQSTSIGLGRTSDEFFLGLAGATNDFYNGVTAGSGVLKLGTANKIHLGTSGAQPTFTIESTMIGINTIYPDATIDLAGDLQIRGQSTANLSTAAMGRIYFDSDDNKFKVSQNNGAYVDLVNTMSGFNANQAIIANGAGVATSFTCSVGQVLGFDASGFAVCTNVTASGGFINGGNSFGAAPTLGTNDNFGLNFETNSATRMMIDNTGRVGIGTTSPQATLDVAGTNQTTASTSDGNLYVRSTDSQAADFGGMIAFGGNDGSGGDRVFASVSGRKENGTSSNYAGYLQFATRTNGSVPAERMRIDSSGNIGVGTSTPTAKLDVDGIISSNTAIKFSPSWIGDGNSKTILTVNSQTTQPQTGNVTGISSIPGVWPNIATPTTSVYGLMSSVSNLATGSGGIITNAYSLYAGTPSHGLGQITNKYGLYISDITGGSSLNYSLYSAGGTNYFAGNVGIGSGTANPSTALDLNGALTQRGMAAPAVSPAGQGRIYFDSTANKFRVSQNNGAYTDLIPAGGTGDILNGGNTTGAAVTIGTNDNFAINFEVNNSSKLTLDTNGNLTFNGGVASNSNGVAFGGGTSSNWYASAFGHDTVASGGESTSFGMETIAPSLGQTSIGFRNAVTGSESSGSWVSTDPLFVIGNATFAAPRSNALMIFKDGRSLFNGGTNTALPAGNATMNVKGSTTDNSAAAFNATNSAATSLFYVRNDGNVGIGTTSPGNILEVNKSQNSETEIRLLNPNTGTAAEATMIVGQNASSPWQAVSLGYQNSGFTTVGMLDANAGNLMSWAGATNGLTVGTDASAPIRFYTGGFTSATNERMRISATGNIGIGTTSPNTALDVSGALSQRGMAAPAVSPAGQGRIYFDSTANKFRVSQNNGAYTDLIPASGAGDILNGGNTTGAAVTIGTNDNFALNFETNGTSRMTVDTNGDVQIADGKFYKFGPTGSTGMGGEGYNIGADYLIFNTAFTERMRIINNGNVGIGTATPTAGLQIAQNGAASTPSTKLSGTWFSGGSATTTKPQLLIEPAGATSTNWDTSGTGLGINAGSTFVGKVLELQKNGTSLLSVDYNASIRSTGSLIFENNANAHIYNNSNSGSLNVSGGSSNGMYLSLNATSNVGSSTTTDYIKFTTNNTATEAMRIINSGNVGIGSTAPATKLEVNGSTNLKGNVALGNPASNSTINDIGASSTINFNNGNIQKIDANSASLTLQNMLPGGSYTVIVYNTTSRTYAFSGCGTVYASPTLSATTQRSVFSIIYTGSECYITWQTGFQ